MKKDLATSKTIFVGILNALLGLLYPDFSTWVAKHPQEYAAIISIIMLALRATTNRGIKWPWS